MVTYCMRSAVDSVLKPALLAKFQQVVHAKDLLLLQVKIYCDVLTDSAIKTVSNEAPRCRCLGGIACILHTGHINTQQLQLFHQQMMIVTDL